jgi:hypothetical protein
MRQIPTGVVLVGLVLAAYHLDLIVCEHPLRHSVSTDAREIAAVFAWPIECLEQPDLQPAQPLIRNSADAAVWGLKWVTASQTVATESLKGVPAA